MGKVFVRSGFPFNYDQEAASDESGLKCLDESRAIQSAALDADINTIVKRFGLTGVAPVSGRVPEYADFEGVTDYRSALHAVMEAEDRFMSLPASTRAFFLNDPQVFLEFAQKPENLGKMRELGLARDLTPEEIRDAEEKARVVERDKKRAKSSEGEDDDESGVDDASARDTRRKPGRL